MTKLGFNNEYPLCVGTVFCHIFKTILIIFSFIPTFIATIPLIRNTVQLGFALLVRTKSAKIIFPSGVCFRPWPGLEIFNKESKDWTR